MHVWVDFDEIINFFIKKNYKFHQKLSTASNWLQKYSIFQLFIAPPISCDTFNWVFHQNWWIYLLRQHRHGFYLQLRLISLNCPFRWVESKKNILIVDCWRIFSCTKQQLWDIKSFLRLRQQIELIISNNSSRIAIKMQFNEKKGDGDSINFWNLNFSMVIKTRRVKKHENLSKNR